MVHAVRCLLLCAIVSLGSGCLTGKLWQPDYPPGPPIVEIPCTIDHAAYSENAGGENMTVAVSFRMEADQAAGAGVPDSLRERLSGNTGWLLIEVSRPLSPLVRALLNDDPALPHHKAALLVRPLLPEEETAASTVKAGFTFKAGLVEPHEEKGQKTMALREIWPCAIVPESSLETATTARFPFTSFTYVGPSAGSAQYSPPLTIARVVATPFTLAVDLPIELLRAVGHAFAR